MLAIIILLAINTVFNFISMISICFLYGIFDCVVDLSVYVRYLRNEKIIENITKQGGKL